MHPACHSMLSPFGRNISASTYWSTNSGITSGSSSEMGNISIFYFSFLYGLYCSVSSTSRCSKSLISAWVPRLCCRDSMSKQHSALHSSHSHSSWVSACYVDLWRTWPFSLIIFTIKAGPISILGPRYLPSVNWSLRDSIISSQNIIQLNHSSSQKLLMSESLQT